MMAAAGFSAVAAAAGSTIGSYVGTAALRASRAEPSTWGRSHCDACGRTLGLMETLPLVSFLAAGGRCRGCGAVIDPVHPTAELLGAAVAVLLILMTPVFTALALGALAAVLLAAAVVDWRTKKLPDVLAGLVALLGLAMAARRGLAALEAGVVAALVVLVVLAGLRAGLSRLKGRQALGWGDIKLISALGLWLGLQTPLMIAAAALLALAVVAIVRPRDGRLPFGPMIGAAGWAVGFALESGLWPG